MVRVLELHSQNWGNSRPLTSSARTSSPTLLSQSMLGGLTTTSAGGSGEQGEFDIEATESAAYMMPGEYVDTLQAPVSNPG